MSFTVALVDFYNTNALSTKFPVCLMAVFVLVSAAGAFLQLSARCYIPRQRSTSFVDVDVEEALDETEESFQTLGLDKLFVDSLPTFVFSKNMAVEAPECSVCLCEFQENETGRLLPKCNHRFHTGCIDTWFHTHSTCPLCRACVGVEESLYIHPYLNEQMDFSASSTSNAGNGTSPSNITSEAARFEESLLLRAFAFDKHKMAAYLQQQGFRFSPGRQQQPAPAPHKSMPLPVNVLFCGRETCTTLHVSSNSSAMEEGHLAMDLPQTCTSPSASWTPTPPTDLPAANNAFPSHLSSIKSIMNMKEQRCGAVPVGCEQRNEAV